MPAARSFRPAGPGDRIVAGLWCASSLALLGAGFLLRDRTISAECSFKTLFHLACPTCGMTRAFTRIVAGDPVGALAMNPLAVVAGLVFIAAGVAAPLWVMARAPVPVRFGSLPAAVRIGALLLFLANWAYLVAAGV